MGHRTVTQSHNQETLRHLTLGAYLQRCQSWDHAFQSATILTHLELVDMRISYVVLAWIAHAHLFHRLSRFSVTCVLVRRLSCLEGQYVVFVYLCLFDLML